MLINKDFVQILIGDEEEDYRRMIDWLCHHNLCMIQQDYDGHGYRVAMPLHIFNTFAKEFDVQIGFS